VSGDALDDFMGGGAKSFPFDNVGDTVTGRITDVQKRQQTDLTTGEPKTWANGEPRWMYSITLQTDLREDEWDDGVRAVNVKWQSQKAVQDAVRKAGAKKLEIGGKLSLKYTGNGPKGNYPQPPKLWAAQYQAPDPTDSFMDDGAREQPRMANHHGDPQSADPPDWARPAADVQARAGGRTSTLDTMRSSTSGTPGEREKFGF
jgi:hypothetical protein